MKENAVLGVHLQAGVGELQVPRVQIGVVLIVQFVDLFDQGLLGDLEDFDLAVGVVVAEEGQAELGGSLSCS